MATTVLCSTIGPSAPSYPAHVRLVHPFQGGDERLMHHDRPLSAIVSRFTVRLAHSLQDGDDRLMQHDRPLSAIVSLSRPDRPSLPGWRRTSYASRSATQRHRVQFTVQLAHSLQDGDDRLMQYDRPLSAIVPSSRSARPSLPGWRRTSYASRSAPQRHRVQIHGSDRPFPPGWRRPSYAVRSAPQRHRTQLTFGSSIPSRVATNVLCITIGHSAPSCPDSRFGSHIPFRMATTVLCSTIGPSAPSCLFHVRIAHPFQDGDERLMLCDRPLSAIVPGFTVRLAHSLQDDDDRLMQHDRPLSAIVSLSRPDRASLPGWRRTSYAVRSAPQRHRT
ncbi:unnamed protein product [Cuscuta epithymum]|uniref:Uncharacterized protein n=1 Tax=Cuscuta epithymum TaxID=186058 RepID=A0AAV0DZ89_9ASTE|nr:unnamed protein product [Cuscuta epithymum]CAH9145657.1 unnamed protein product [Cuscuta epithymum]